MEGAVEGTAAVGEGTAEVGEGRAGEEGAVKGGAREECAAAM